MNKRLTIIAVTMVMAITSIFSSCSDKNEQDENSITQQAILIFMPWSGSASSAGLYQSLLLNLDSIEAGIKAQKGLKNSQVFVALGNNATNTQLYEVKYSNGNCLHTNIKTYSSKEAATTNGIADIINEVKKHSNALNYAMIIGCHGSGWTSKSDWQQYPYYAKAFRTYNGGVAKKGDYPLTRFFGSVNDMDYAIDINTLADAIAQTDTKMQYILFDNCYMANVETAYALKDVTNFMVASTSEVMGIGMPYKMMWSYLATATPNYDQMVQTFYKFYSSYEYPYGSLSAIDCRQMDALAELMKKINSKYTFNTSLRDSIQTLGGFKPTIFYDLGSYIDNLVIDEQLKSEFNNQLSKVVKYKKSTDRLYSYLYLTDGPTYIDVNDFSGITTSAPSNNPVAIKGWNNTKWAKATNNQTH